MLGLEGLAQALLTWYPLPARQHVVFGAANGRDDQFAITVDEYGSYAQAGRTAGDYRDSRDRAFPLDKSSGVTRIVCLGASETFGVGVDKNHCFPALLEEMLSEGFSSQGRPAFEVVNAGFMGYHSWHSRILLERELWRLHPDIVVVMHGPNDALSAAVLRDAKAFRKEVDEIRRSGHESPQGLQALLDRADSACNLTIGVYRVGKHLLRLVSMDGEPPLSLRDQFDLFGYEGNIRAIVEEGEQRGFATVVVNYPWPARKGDEARRPPSEWTAGKGPLYEFGREYFDAKNKMLTASGRALLVDSQADFDRILDTRSAALLGRLYTDGIHFTKYGNALVARSIVTELARSGLVQPRAAARTEESLDQEMTRLQPQLFFTNGWPEPPAVAQPYGTQRVEHARERPEGPPGWSVVEAASPDRPASLILRRLGEARTAPMPGNGVFNTFFYPRVGGAGDQVRVLDAQGREVFRLTGSAARPAWTGVSDKFGCTLPEGPAGETLTIELTGKAQLWRSSQAVLFTNDTVSPGS